MVLGEYFYFKGRSIRVHERERTESVTTNSDK